MNQNLRFALRSFIPPDAPSPYAGVVSERVVPAHVPSQYAGVVNEGGVTSPAPSPYLGVVNGADPGIEMNTNQTSYLDPVGFLKPVIPTEDEQVQ